MLYRFRLLIGSRAIEVRNPVQSKQAGKSCASREGKIRAFEAIGDVAIVHEL